MTIIKSKNGSLYIEPSEHQIPKSTKVFGGTNYFLGCHFGAGCQSFFLCASPDSLLAIDCPPWYPTFVLCGIWKINLASLISTLKVRPLQIFQSDVEAPQMEMPQWDGGSRINIVFFGLRGGEISGDDCPACTDTIMLLTIDPVTKTAGMLSIPRDMWVNIPGFGYSRINTAWTSGEGAKLPGGGPGLAMETVSQFIGVPIHYYVQVDFGTFVSFINLIGGIDVYVDERMVLDPAGTGQDHFVLTPGDFRHLNGKRALAYARCRHESQGCSGGDVGRAKRQQQGHHGDQGQGV